MKNTAYMEIKIDGKKDGKPLLPDNLDIAEIREILEQAGQLLFPNDKNRPTITYQLLEGSVKHRFTTTAVQAVIVLNALIGQINKQGSLNDCDDKTVKGIEYLQEQVIDKSYTIDISTSTAKSNKLHLDKTTQYRRSESLWVDVELYLYGEITEFGGKTQPAIDLDTKEYGIVQIRTTKDSLKQIENTRLYEFAAVRVQAKQNPLTQNVDKTSFRFIDFAEYVPRYDEEYLNSLIRKAKKSWEDVPDVDVWLQEVRGYSRA